MKHEEYYADDRHIVPDFIDKMSDAELDAFIAEREAQVIKQNALRATKVTSPSRVSA